MTFHRITTLTSCLTLTLFAAACDVGDKNDDAAANDDETGDPGEGNGDGDGDGDGEDQAGYGGDCGEETVSVVEDLGAALAGFDGPANDYIAQLEGTFAGDFSWMPDDGPVTNEHAGTSSPLTMTVTYEGGEVRLTEVELVGQPPQGGLELEGGVCSNILEVDVTLGFATEDGLFAEAFEIPVRIYSDSEYAKPGFYFSLDMAALEGQLALADFSVDDGTIRDLVLIGEIDGDNAHGSLNIEIGTMDWVGFGSIASFETIRQ